ncbi:MAG: hypothetical protein OEU92_09395 [Alphaproteobacteria bacterium]|nr:hypothetical protein [Alphaproteobacteria bacterium]
MADGTFNIAKGRVAELVNRVASNDPANSALVVVLLRTSVVDATLEDFDDLGAILADAGVDEADFTNYARKVLTDAVVSAPTPDDTNNRQDSDIPDQTFVNAGGATNNNLVKLLVCYDADTTGGTDANIIPLTHHDYVATTDGNDLRAIVDPGFHRAA